MAIKICCKPLFVRVYVLVNYNYFDTTFIYKIVCKCVVLNKNVLIRKNKK